MCSCLKRCSCNENHGDSRAEVNNAAHEVLHYCNQLDTLCGKHAGSNLLRNKCTLCSTCCHVSARQAASSAVSLLLHLLHGITIYVPSTDRHSPFDALCSWEHRFRRAKRSPRSAMARAATDDAKNRQRMSTITFTDSAESRRCRTYDTVEHIENCTLILRRLM